MSDPSISIELSKIEKQLHRIADQLQWANQIGAINIVSPLAYQKKGEDIESGRDMMDQIVEHILIGVGYPSLEKSLKEVRAEIMKMREVEVKPDGGQRSEDSE